MDPLGHKNSAVFDPDVLSQSDDDDDDFMLETKKSPFQAFPPMSDGLKETTAASRYVEVSESPSPDLVPDAYDEGHTPSEELKPETDADAPVSLSYAPSDHYSNLNTASDDRPTSLPDILKSSPLNPDKLDSGSSEESPDFSPVHKSVDDSPNSPFPANYPFGFDSKIMLLKEMAEEAETRAGEMTQLEAENNSEQSFTAFDLVKDTDMPPKTDGLLKDKEMISQTPVQTADRFECLGFPGGNTRELSDSESPSADSFSPVLDAVTQEPSKQEWRATQGPMDTAEEPSEQEWRATQGPMDTAEEPSEQEWRATQGPMDTAEEASEQEWRATQGPMDTAEELSEQEWRATQGPMDTAEEASEQEFSSEEFEFVERPPQGAAEEFLEMQDSLAFSQPSEMPQDEDRSPELEPQEAADLTPTTEVADKQSSYHLLTQASDKYSARGKGSDFQEISPAPVICAPADKPGPEKEAEGSMCDLSAAAGKFSKDRHHHRTCSFTLSMYLHHHLCFVLYSPHRSYVYRASHLWQGMILHYDMMLHDHPFPLICLVSHQLWPNMTRRLVYD